MGAFAEHMHKLLAGMFILGLCLGWVIHEAPNTIFEQPSNGLTEHASPQQRITLNDISQTEQSVTIQQPNTLLVRYTNTNSMDPTLDDNSIGIEQPYEGQLLHIGDIISYTYEGKRLVHRIRNIQGTTYTLQGDNSNISHTIQQHNIQGILLGVLY